MKFVYAVGSDGSSPRSISYASRKKAIIQDDGTFEVPEDTDNFEAIKARLIELGHEPVDAEEPEPEEPDLTQFSEEDLVTMDYRELQSLGANFEDISGNWASGKLEEALIMRRRDQLE